VKSHIPTANTPARIKVPEGQLIYIAVNGSKTRLKRGRSVGAKDKIPRKRKIQEKQVAAPEEAIPMKQATNIIDLSKIVHTNLLKMNLLKRKLLKSYPQKRSKYLKMMRSQYIM
jgi:hypothetical protein